MYGFQTKKKKKEINCQQVFQTTEIMFTFFTEMGLSSILKMKRKLYVFQIVADTSFYYYKNKKYF